MFRLKLALSVFGALLLLGTLPACSHGNLGFKTLYPFSSPVDFYCNYEARDPGIAVISQEDSPLPESIDGPFWRDSLANVDFHRYFVVFVFYGFPASANDVVEVSSVRADQSTITVKARFYTRKSNSVTSEMVSPAQAIRVSKANMKTFGRLSFRLVDATGQERATTNATISG